MSANETAAFAVANLVHTECGSLVESTPSAVGSGSMEPGSRSSAGERLLHTQDVASSILAATTNPYVYVLRAQTAGLYKIGVASDPPARMKQLQSASPDTLELVTVFRPASGFVMERMLHNRYREHRSHAEWFRPSEALTAWLHDEAIPANVKGVSRRCKTALWSVTRRYQSSADAARRK